MRTYKKGISLIVLVITIIVLAILASAVIITISNNNIMSNAQKATFRSDMANFKDIYEVYVIDKKIENVKFKEESLNLTYASNPEEFVNIFGNNVPDKYINGLEIKKGKLVYNTDNEQELEILGELGMVKLPDPIITLSQNEVSIAIDEGSTATYQLDATLANATGTLEWNSLNTNVAEVSSSGLVTAKAVGTATITVKYQDVTATCLVTVTLKIPDIVDISNIQIGDLVSYTPTANATTEYTGATYIKDTDEDSDTYNTYIESTTTYKPGTMKWVYLGQDENGNVLLTSQEATSFTMTIAGQDGWVTGPDRMDALCNTLYGNSTYAKETRNMKIEDVNRVLGYNGPKGIYVDLFTGAVETPTPMTFGEIAGAATTISERTPRLSTKAFEDYLSDSYKYTGITYKANTTDEYKVIFTKADGTTNQSNYWLSSPATLFRWDAEDARFTVRAVKDGSVDASTPYNSRHLEGQHSWALRPVIILKSNIQFGEKNSSGEWRLVET